jgi:uncharacterized membrane protein YhhN
LKKEVKSYAISFVLLTSALFVLLYDKDFKELAVGLFAFGVARILYK